MIVDHASSLHEGIANRGANEAKTAPLQVLAQSVRFGGRGGQALRTAPPVYFGLAANEAPDVPVKAPKFIANREKGLRVPNRSRNFQAVADDPRIRQQL